MTKFLKAALIGSVLTIALGTQAYAADYAPPVQEAPTPEEYQQMGWYLRGDLGWSFLDWSGGDNDNAFAIGGGAGYQFNPYLRSDVRVDWSGNYEVAPGADMNMTTVLGNLYVDIPTGTWLTPYAGAGLGYGWASIDDAKDKDGFTYALMAGVSVDLSQSIALDVGYRFREIVDSGPDPKDHSVLGGIRFKF